MTHPFHPLAGRELEFVKRRRNYGDDLVYVYGVDGELLPLIRVLAETSGMTITS